MYDMFMMSYMRTGWSYIARYKIWRGHEHSDGPWGAHVMVSEAHAMHLVRVAQMHASCAPQGPLSFRKDI